MTVRRLSARLIAVVFHVCIASVCNIAADGVCITVDASATVWGGNDGDCPHNGKKVQTQGRALLQTLPRHERSAEGEGGIALVDTSSEPPSALRHLMLTNAWEVGDQKPVPKGRIVDRAAEAVTSILPAVNKTMSTLMPGWDLRSGMCRITILSVVVCVIWFFVYFCAIFTPDSGVELVWRGDKATGARIGKPRVSASSRERQIDPGESPDMVLMFHHPNHKHEDADSMVSLASIEMVLLGGSCKRVEHEMGLTRVVVEKGSSPCLRDYAFLRPVRRFRQDVPGAVEASPGDVLRPVMTFIHQVEGLVHQATPAQGTTRSAVRIALLQDMHEHLLASGFNVGVYNSIFEDKLFLCVSLADPDAVEGYVLRRNVRLQVRDAVVRSLGIGTAPVPRISSPPTIQYEPRIVDSLYTAGVLPVADKYQLFEDAGGREPGVLFSGRERIRTVFQELSSHIDLDAAKEEGLLVDWFPGHDPAWVEELREIWANWRCIFDLRFMQPVQLLREYFGTRVAFAFAWQGLLCKALLALLPVALLLEVVAIAEEKVLDVDWADTRRVLAPSFILVVWARITLNLWDREEEYFIELWEIEPRTFCLPRPGFRGFLRPSPIDANFEELQYPEFWSKVRYHCSTFCSVLFCLCVLVGIVVWIRIFNGRMHLYASICLCLQIKSLEFINDHLVQWLTDWENHRYMAEYYNSYLFKNFLFQSVNNYAPFLYLALVVCPKGECLTVLRSQLVRTQVILSLFLIVQVAYSSLTVRFRLWHESYQLKAKCENPPKHTFVEQQVKFRDFQTKEQVRTMTQLMIPLGFVLLFGAVAPIIMPFCCCVFVIALRANAFMLVNASRRSVPLQMAGIGEWRHIVSILMRAGILLSGVLMVTYGDAFREVELLTRISTVLAFCVCGFIVWEIVDAILPPTDGAAGLLAARRSHVRRRIVEHCDHLDVQSSSLGVPSVEAVSAVTAKTAVQKRAWGEIPYLSDKRSSRELASASATPR